MRHRWWQCTKSSSRQRCSCRRPCGSCRWSMWRRRRQPNPRTCRVAANQRGRHSAVEPRTVDDRVAFAKGISVWAAAAAPDNRRAGLALAGHTDVRTSRLRLILYCRSRVSRDDRYTAVGKMFLAAPLDETRSALQSKCSKLDDALQLHAVIRNSPTRSPTHPPVFRPLIDVCPSLSCPCTIEQLPMTMLQKNKEFLEKQLLEMGKNLEVRATITPSNHFRQLPTSRWLRCCQELMAAQQE